MFTVPPLAVQMIEVLIICIDLKGAVREGAGEMTVVQLVNCQAVKLAMEKEAVATPEYFQQMDLERQGSLGI